MKVQTKISKVSNMTSSNGNTIANQFVISNATIKAGCKNYTGDVFQSYDSVIAFDGDITLLDETYWNYSRTTSKYRNQFLGMDTKETQAKIDSGEIKLVDLN